MDAQKIRDAIAKLDAAVDAHWTESGKPSIKALEEFLGESISRAEVNVAAKDATRPTVSPVDPAEAGDDTGGATADPRLLDQAERERIAQTRNRAAQARVSAAASDGASEGVSAEELSERNKRERLVKELGDDDARIEALMGSRADLVGDRIGRLRSREEKIKIADRKRLRGNAEYMANARIAAERGTHAAPDFVAGKTVVVHDRYYYEGRFYEAGQKIVGFVGRLGLKMELSD